MKGACNIDEDAISLGCVHVDPVRSYVDRKGRGNSYHLILLYLTGFSHKSLDQGSK